MSYIIKSEQPFASTKLTETGREKLAKGQLDFTSWSVGDSEINYNREIYTQNNVLTGKTTSILRPKDKQVDLKNFIKKSNGTTKFSFGVGDIKCIKLTVNNEADERGHFIGNLASGFTTNTSITGYINASGSITSSAINGGNTLNIGVSGSVVGDFLLLKLGNTDFTNETPNPHLFYRVDSVSGTTLTVDREIPSVSTGDATFIVYKGGNIYDNEPDSISYWDTGTLSFDNSSDISVTDVPIWNMNIPFTEDILGVTGTTEYESFINYGSYDFIGEKDDYLYPSTTEYFKSCAIIHYSNKTISNLYGEFFFIDEDNNKTVKIHLPDLMYHRRVFNGTGTADKMGMTFLSSGNVVTTGSNGLSYIPLMEDSTLVNGEPKQVGRVYPNLKIITIDDPEIIATMSYKSNRNWTLPNLRLNLTSSGGGTGFLLPNETIFVTYSVGNSGGGITSSLPCQDYVEIKNGGTRAFNVEVNVEDLSLLPYMMNDDISGGFYGDSFKIIYQITDGSRPSSDGWKEIDFTSSVISGGFVNANTLEEGTFYLNQTNVDVANIHSNIETLNLAQSSSPESLQFGDERFFYGNIEAFIGATIFKTIFKIAINASDFVETTNPTRDNNPTTNPPNLVVSEVGIYDSVGDLVIISKLSQPVQLKSGKTVIFELSMDF